MCFEESGEGAVGFWVGPSIERYCVFGGHFRLDSTGYIGALWVDVVEVVSIDLVASVACALGMMVLVCGVGVLVLSVAWLVCGCGV